MLLIESERRNFNFFQKCYFANFESHFFHQQGLDGGKYWPLCLLLLQIFSFQSENSVKNNSFRQMTIVSFSKQRQLLLLSLKIISAVLVFKIEKIIPLNEGSSQIRKFRKKPNQK